MLASTYTASEPTAIREVIEVLHFPFSLFYTWKLPVKILTKSYISWGGYISSQLHRLDISILKLFPDTSLLENIPKGNDISHHDSFFWFAPSRKDTVIVTLHPGFQGMKGVRALYMPIKLLSPHLRAFLCHSGHPGFHNTTVGWNSTILQKITILYKNGTCGKRNGWKSIVNNLV